MPLRLVSIPIRNLRHRPLRTLFTVIGIAVAVGGFSTLTGLGRGLEDAWSRSLHAQGAHLLAYRRGSMDILAGSLDQTLAAEIRAIAGIEEVAPELVDLVSLEGGESVVVRGWEEHGMLWRAATLVAGRLPSPRAGGEALLGQSLAAALGVGPGDQVLPFGAALRVVGVAKLPGLLNNHSMILPLDDMQQLLNRQGQVTAFNVRVAQGGDQAAVAEAQRRLSRRFPQLTFTDVEFVPQQNEMYRVWRGMAWAVSLVGLAMGLVMVLNTLLVAVLERTREIGVLVALGWPRRRILWMVVLEGLMLTFAGGLVGITAGTVALTVLSTHPKLRGFIEVSTSPHAALQHFLAVVVLGVAGAIYPAWRATRLNPIDALREP